MANTVMGCIWYLDSSASFHMTGNQDLFSDLEEKDLQQSIEFGDDERYSTTGIGTVTFQRQSSKPFPLKDVMHVPGLNKNLVSVAMLEDRGYDVVFSEGKVFLRHKATGQAKKIGILVKNLYRLDVDAISRELPTIGKCEKAMQLTLERKLDFHAEEELLVPKNEPQDVEQPHAQDHGVEKTIEIDKFQEKWEEGVHAAIPPGVRWGDVQN